MEVALNIMDRHMIVCLNCFQILTRIVRCR